MPRFPVAPITVLAVVAVPLLALGCAKRLATAVAPAPTAGATTTPSPGGPPAGPPSRATAPPNPGAAGAPAPPSAAGPGAPAARPAGPPAPRPNPREFGAVHDVDDIHFDFDRYDIRPDAARILDANARWLKANPAALVLIEGHADERGTNEYNLALGERRAVSARTYLVSLGIPADRIKTVSYGKEFPFDPGHDEGAWSKNRRAHFVVTAK